MIRKKRIPNGKLEFFLLRLQHVIACPAYCEHGEHILPFFATAFCIFLSQAVHLFFIGQRFPDISSFSLLFSGPSPRRAYLQVEQSDFKHSIPCGALTYVEFFLEANLLFRQELASPATARHHCLRLWAAEASAPLLHGCYRATRRLACICGAGYFCLSWGPEICLQGLYKHLPGCGIGAWGGMLGSQVAWFPKPQRFGNCFLKHAHQKCVER